MNTPPGGVLNRRYELRRRLDAGGMGTVWEAYDRVLARKVAAKALISEADYDDGLQVMRERMRREALALALVDHPAVVTVHDLIYDSEDPWIVMGYVDGQTLAEYVTVNSRLPEQEIASLGLDVLQGLLACHAKNVLHRDVKPANIIRMPEGSARLVDFGIARISTMQTLTPTSKVIGTPEFMAPEVLRSSQAASQGTDLWSLGATLYYALEGRSPFGKPTLIGTIAAIGGSEPPHPPRSHGPLARLVLRMLRKDPAERLDAIVVRDELRRIAGSGMSPGRPVREGKPPHSKSAPTVQFDDPHKEYTPPSRPQVQLGDTWAPPSAKPLTWLSGKPDSEAAKIIAGLSPERAIADLQALEDTEAARVILRCDVPLAGRLLSLAAADRPAWTRKIIEMVTRARAGQLLDNMAAAASAAALALPPAQGAARILARANDATVKAVLYELARERPGRGAPLVIALDELEAGRVAQALGNSEPVAVARLLHYVGAQDRRENLLGRLPWQFRPLVEKHLDGMADND